MMIMAHAACASRHLTHACDTHYVWIEEDILVGGKWQFREGRLPDYVTDSLEAWFDLAEAGRR